MDRLTFYRGLLFALRLRRPRFPAEGDVFQRAVGLTIGRALETEEGASLQIDLEEDPVFGVYPEANELILEGEQDLILSLLNPHHKEALFKINEVLAAEELERLPAPGWFRELATFFDEQLSSAA